MASRKTPSRSRSERRRRAKRVAFISAALLLVTALSFPLWGPLAGRLIGEQILGSSRHFRVRSTVVVGNRTIPTAKIMAMAGVSTGMPLFAIHTSSVLARVEKHPWIRYCYVRRRLPDTIEIRVVEREPVAAVRGDGLLMITADSMAVAPLTENWVWDLPLLTPPRPLKLKAGSVITDSMTLSLLREALTVRAVSPAALQNLSELYFSGNQMHAALSHPQAELVLGEGGSELAWTGALKYLSSRSNAAPPPTLDLRVPGKIIVTENSSTAVEQAHG